MAEKWGDSTKLYGDATRLLGDRPFPYPSPSHVTLEIRTASGTDYVSKAWDTSFRIESNLAARTSRMNFTFRENGQSAIDDHDEVIMTDQSGRRLFGGFVESFRERDQPGPYFDYDVVAIGYTWLLDYSTVPSGITDVITMSVAYPDDTADSTIIADVFARYVNSDFNYIDATTYVATVAILKKQTYKNLSPRQILDHLARVTGAEWYVDYGPAGSYKAYLHWFEPGSKDADYELADIESGLVDYITYFPYEALEKERRHGTCNRVTVEGRPEILEGTSRWLTGDGTTTIELPFRVFPATGYGGVPYIEVAGVEQDVGNGAVSGETLVNNDVLWYPGDNYLEFAVAPPQLQVIKVICDEVQETFGYAQDDAGYAKYHRWLTVNVKDWAVQDDADATLMAAALLARWKASVDTYSCIASEPGLMAGNVVALTATNRGLAREELVIQQITSHINAKHAWKHELVMGQYVPDTVDIVRDINAAKLNRAELEDLYLGGGGLAGTGTDNHVVRWDGVRGLQDSGVIIDDDNRMGVNNLLPQGQMHIEQDDAVGAIPVLVLDQADVDEAFIEIIGESADGDLTRSLVEEGDQGSEARQAWAMLEVDDVGGQIAGTKLFLPLYSLSA